MNVKTVAALTLGLSGCMVGPNLDTLEPAHDARGTETTMSIEVVGRNVTQTGELVAVRDEDFLVLTSDGLMRVPHAMVRDAEFTDARPGRIRDAGTPSQRRSLANFSRYPLGLSDEQLSGLLAALGQDQLLRPAR